MECEIITFQSNLQEYIVDFSKQNMFEMMVL